MTPGRAIIHAPLVLQLSMPPWSCNHPCPPGLAIIHAPPGLAIIHAPLVLQSSMPPWSCNYPCPPGLAIIHAPLVFAIIHAPWSLQLSMPPWPLQLPMSPWSCNYPCPLVLRSHVFFTLSVASIHPPLLPKIRLNKYYIKFKGMFTPKWKLIPRSVWDAELNGEGPA